MADTREAHDLLDRKALAFELTDTVITHALGQSVEIVRLVWFEQRLRKLKRVSITHMSAITEAIAIRLARGAKCKKSLGIPEQPEHAISLTNSRIAHILAKAAPAIERSSANSGFRRVIVNVTNAVEQLIIIENRHTLKSILENRTSPACLRIEIHGIRRRNRMHTIAQVSMPVI